MQFFWNKPAPVISISTKPPVRIVSIKRRVKLSEAMKLELSDTAGGLRRARQTLEQHRLL